MRETERVRIRDVKTLADNWGVLKKTTFDYRRKDGTWQTQVRETYDRGNGAVLLLYNEEQGTVILTRQFRFPVYISGHHDDMIEACAGLLEENDPETAIRLEAEEETGYRIGPIKKLWEAYMSPGSVTEKLHFFIAPYDPSMKTTDGGGRHDEGEDITVLEMPLDDAMAMIKGGKIIDAKTIMLLQYAALERL